MFNLFYTVNILRIGLLHADTNELGTLVVLSVRARGGFFRASQVTEKKKPLIQVFCTFFPSTPEPQRLGLCLVSMEPGCGKLRGRARHSPLSSQDLAVGNAAQVRSLSCLIP